MKGKGVTCVLKLNSRAVRTHFPSKFVSTTVTGLNKKKKRVVIEVFCETGRIFTFSRTRIVRSTRLEY